MQIAGRGFGKIAGSVLHRRNYTAARNMLRVYEHPAQVFRRYLTGSGSYPTNTLQHWGGIAQFTLKSH